MIKCIDVMNEMEKLAPIKLAEEWDNVGLLVGDQECEVKRVLVALDVTLDVIEEAIDKKADMIIARHPMILNRLRKLLKMTC